MKTASFGLGGFLCGFLVASRDLLKRKLFVACLEGCVLRLEKSVFRNQGKRKPLFSTQNSKAESPGFLKDPKTFGYLLLGRVGGTRVLIRRSLKLSFSLSQAITFKAKLQGRISGLPKGTPGSLAIC